MNLLPEDLVSVDLETECAVEGCVEACDHALSPHTARITLVACYRTDESLYVGQDIAQAKEFIGTSPIVGHGFGFDMHMLEYHGFGIPLEQWVHDTKVMASVCLDKIPKTWLERYNERRTVLNKELPRGYSHRKGTPNSLKTLAPFHLGVEPFWEDPTNHDDPDYALKDAQYTLWLAQRFASKLDETGLWSFYRDQLMPWQRLLYKAEHRGISLDLEELERLKKETKKNEGVYFTELSSAFASGLATRRDNEILSLRQRYKSKENNYTKAHPTADKVKTKERYLNWRRQAEDKLEAFNFDSPTQLQWLLGDYCGFDLLAPDKDNPGKFKKSTDKKVLKRLLLRGNKEIEPLLNYRKCKQREKLYFTPWPAFARDGVIHCSYNIDGTRTGRLSCREPNLQQVEKDPGIRGLFIPRPGYKLATFDMSAIEAVLIAYYSEDPTLCKIILEGQDFHGFNAKYLYFDGIYCEVNEVKKLVPEKRDFSKTLGYALFYGARGGRIRSSAWERGYDWTKTFCNGLYENFMGQYSGALDYKRHIDAQAETGAITNCFGRKHTYPDKSDIRMKAFNTLIQSSASDMVCDSALNIQNEFDAKGIDAHVLLLVHDEIVSEIPEDRVEECEEIIVRNMTDYTLNTKFGVLPLQAEGVTDDRWIKS